MMGAFVASANVLEPTGLEIAITLFGLVYLVLGLVLMVFGVVVLLTWHRKNKLRIIELEFEEEAIRRKKVGN